MTGYKTFSIAIMLTIVASVLLYLKAIESEDFMKIIGFVCSMVGVREVAQKLLKKE